MGELGGTGPPPPAGGVVGDEGDGDPGGVTVGDDVGLAGVGDLTGVMLHSFWQLACEHGTRFEAGLINGCLKDPNVATMNTCMALLANPAFWVDAVF